MHFFAQAPLGADAKTIAHDQHAKHQGGINGETANGAVERRQVLADIA
jgi:hypothetical protein